MQKMFVIALLAVAFLAASYAQAPSGYPNRPVKIIVTFAPGGPTDVGARLIGQKLSDSLKQRFYIENMPGAGGNIGTANAAKAPPDGYTILFAASPYVINPSLYAKIPYDPYNDFIPLTVVANAPNLLPDFIRLCLPRTLGNWSIFCAPIRGSMPLPRPVSAAGRTLPAKF